MARRASATLDDLPTHALNIWRLPSCEARPMAVSSVNLELVRKANPQDLINFGRLPDVYFDQLWSERLQKTQRRLNLIFEQLGVANSQEMSKNRVAARSQIEAAATSHIKFN